MNLPENVIREDDKFIFNFTTGKIIRKLKNGNEKLGDTELFMVPIGKDKDGVIFQSLFNRLVEE